MHELLEDRLMRDGVEQTWPDGNIEPKSARGTPRTTLLVSGKSIPALLRQQAIVCCRIAPVASTGSATSKATPQAASQLFLIGHPGRARRIVLKARRTLQIIFCLVERKPPLIVLLGGLHGCERNDDVLLAGSQESAYT